jgi:hypothetical protein
MPETQGAVDCIRSKPTAHQKINPRNRLPGKCGRRPVDTDAEDAKKVAQDMTVVAELQAFPQQRHPTTGVLN